MPVIKVLNDNIVKANIGLCELHVKKWSDVGKTLLELATSGNLDDKQIDHVAEAIVACDEMTGKWRASLMSALNRDLFEDEQC